MNLIKDKTRGGPSHERYDPERVVHRKRHETHQVSGRYGQDPYGMINLRSRFPGLYYAPQLSKLSPDSDEYHLILNGCLRDRNRVSDALQDALDGMEIEIKEE